MSLEHASITWSAKQLSNMIKNGKIDFNHIVQRSYVWEKSRKTSLIESLILGYDIPKIYAKRTLGESGKRNSNSYAILDGKQRLSAIKQFINNEFSLTEIPEITYYDEELGENKTENISGLLFSQLPTGLQDLLCATTFNIVYYDNLTKSEEMELFKRLNNGKPLSTKSRTLASCQNIEELLDIGSHDIFTEMLSEKSRDNKNQVTLVMKAWCMLNQDISTVSFESKIFNPLIEETSISDEQRYILATVFDYAQDTHSVLVERKEKKLASKMYKETHFISLIPFFQKASDMDIKEELFADWIKEFYGTLDGASISDIYNEAVNNGVSKNVNVVLRDTELAKSFNEFFNSEDSEQPSVMPEESLIMAETAEEAEAKEQAEPVQEGDSSDKSVQEGEILNESETNAASYKASSDGFVNAEQSSI